MPAAAPAPRRGRGVALGVLGLMLLVFFSLVFMLGRHSYWHRLYDEMVHPFDPHPDGVIRHKTTVVHESGRALGRGACLQQLVQYSLKRASIRHFVWLHIISMLLNA